MGSRITLFVPQGLVVLVRRGLQRRSRAGKDIFDPANHSRRQYRELMVCSPEHGRIAILASRRLCAVGESPSSFSSFRLFPFHNNRSRRAAGLRSLPRHSPSWSGACDVQRDRLVDMFHRRSLRFVLRLAPAQWPARRCKLPPRARPSNSPPNHRSRPASPRRHVQGQARVTCRDRYALQLRPCLWLRALFFLIALVSAAAEALLCLAPGSKFPPILPFITRRISNIASVACGAKDALTGSCSPTSASATSHQLFPPPSSDHIPISASFPHQPPRTSKLHRLCRSVGS